MGFLKQIQRNRAGGSTQGDGILLKSNPTNHPHSPTTEVQDREALKKPADRQPPEKPAAHAGGEKQERRKRRDTSPHAGNTAASLRVIRKQQADKPAPALVGKITDSLPAWLKEGKKVNPNVELLCPEARRILNDILPTDEDAEIDLEEAIRESVQLAASALSGEVRISENDKDEATEELIKLLTGKGPLQPLYDDPAVTDIFIDNHEMIRCIRRGRAMETPFRFRSREEYKAYVNALLQSVDRNLNLSSPIVDCVLNDEFRSRINAVDPSCIEGDEPRLCLRIPRLQKITFYDILQTKTLPASLAAWLSEVVATGEANILILGPTGSGKTVFTTALLSAVRMNELLRLKTCQKFLFRLDN